jgi:hypothetical protein
MSNDGPPLAIDPICSFLIVLLLFGGGVVSWRPTRQRLMK